MRHHILPRLVLFLAALVLLLAANPTLAAKPLRAESRVVEVQSVPDDDHGSGTLLLEAQASAASHGGPWLLRLGPGTYDLGDRVLRMADGVSIEGSGIESTRVIGEGQPPTDVDLSRGVVVGAEAQLSELTVRCANEAAEDFCITMANLEASPRIHRVRFASDGDGSHWGVRNVDASPILEEVEIHVSGGINNYAISNVRDSYPEIQRSILSASDGSGQNVVIYSKLGACPARIDDSELHAIGGQFAVGIYSDGVNGATQPVAVIDDVVIRADGNQLAAGIYGGNYDLRIQGSVVEAGGADGRGIEMEEFSRLVAVHTELLAQQVAAFAGTVELGSSRLEDGIVVAYSSEAVCVGVFRFGSDPTFYASECPPITSSFAATKIRLSEVR